MRRRRKASHMTVRQSIVNFERRSFGTLSSIVSQAVLLGKLDKLDEITSRRYINSRVSSERRRSFANFLRYL